MSQLFKKTILSNGIRVLSEQHADSKALCLAATVGIGTRDEIPKHIGMSHFLEHMVFKGTKKRNAYQIVRSLEAVGGEVNAYTSREHTTYHTMTLSEDWKLGCDILVDLCKNAAFPEQEFDREKSVVLQEILSANDQLEEYIFDEFYEKIYPGDPTGWPILGTEESLSAIKRKDLNKYYKENYCGASLIFTAAGNIDHEKIVQYLEEKLVKMSKGKVNYHRKKPKYKRLIDFQKKPCEQAHILMGFPSSNYISKTRLDAYFLNILLGGGMTSKLYQSVREKKGLVYTIYSQLQTYSDSGMMMMYAATDAAQTVKVIKEICRVLKQVKERGISKSDLKLYKNQLRSSLIIGAEDIENRMNSLAVNEMVFSKYLPLQSILDEMDDISVESVNKLIKREIKSSRLSALILGPGFGSDFTGSEKSTVREIISGID